MKPTRCIILPSIFISTSPHVSGNYVPIVRRTYCIYATLVFFTLYGWLSGQVVGMRLRVAVWSAGWDETAGGCLVCWFGWDCWWLSGQVVGMRLWVGFWSVGWDETVGGCLVCWLGWDCGWVSGLLIGMRLVSSQLAEKTATHRE
jgi:hypothetical protein